MSLLLTLGSYARAAGTGPTILVVGDSISAGFGIPVQQGWVTLMEQQLQQRVPAAIVVNASISGDTTQGGVVRLPALLGKHRPDLVIIELGGNDGLRGTPLKLIEANLKRMITLSQDSGAEVLLAGMQIPPNYGQRYADGFADLYPQLAEQHGALLLPRFLEPVASRPELMQADGIHPKAEAQPEMAGRMLDAMSGWIDQLLARA